MKKKLLHIGNCQAFWGDSSLAAKNLIEHAPFLDYLTLDYLAELSLSILAAQKAKDPNAGYAKDFLKVVKTLIPYWQKGVKTKLIVNAGGLNPKACALACAKLLKEENINLRVGVLCGDDILPLIAENIKNGRCDASLNNSETGDNITTIFEKLTSANAYLGASSMAELLKKGADIVITGRVADPSLTVAACLAEFDWQENDYDKLAAATVAGHLLECGTQVSGGLHYDWLSLQQQGDIPFPIAEISFDGSVVLTKPPGSFGLVNTSTVTEQLLYEIADPGRYLSPDVTVSFANIKLIQQAADRVRIEGVVGQAPTNSYKVSACYFAGYKAEAYLTLFGHGAEKNAKACASLLFDRLKKGGYPLQKTCVECLGTGDAVPGVFMSKKNSNIIECVLRVAACDETYSNVEAFTNEIASLVTCGPPGVTGYNSGKAKVRPRYGFWPCLIEKQLVKPEIELIDI